LAVVSAGSAAYRAVVSRADCLNFRDKLAISRAMAALIPCAPADLGESFLDWLQHHGQTGQAIERFWKTMLVSALSEDLDLVSVPTRRRWCASLF
jgi:hypothetical protein